MFKLKITLALSLLAIGSLIVMGQNTTTATQGKDIYSLKWMTGNWSGVDGTVEMEEVWTAPKGNTMLGLHRDVKADRTVLFEFLRIEATADAITYWASPKGRPATPFKLTEVRENYVAFENPAHDFPKKIIYWLADGALHAKIEGMVNGKMMSEEWVWKKQ